MFATCAIFVLSNDGLIARGNGRCYGDSSLGENILSTLKLNHFLSFDADQGFIECESGVLLSDILDVIVPIGFFLPVTPGTKYITVGGAIAADVHGKNHHCEGSFSNHVLSSAGPDIPKAMLYRVRRTKTLSFFGKRVAGWD